MKGGAMNRHVEEWCYAECERQHATTPADIDNMAVAYGFATGIAERMAQEGGSIFLWEIVGLGMCVDPVANPGGRFRTGPAVFLNGGDAVPAHEIHIYLDALLNTHNDPDWPLTPDEFYQQLMYVHPFKDGNGRVGALVYNVLNGTIDNPVTPPDY